MTMLLRIAERVLNRPLLVHPDKVPLILGVLDGRIPLGDVSGLRDAADARIDVMPEAAQTVMRGPSPGASRFIGEAVEQDDQGRTRALPYRRTKEGVAVITVTGSLINRGAWLGSNSGETSYEGIKYQIARAAADPRAKAILLDIESPGGEAVGAFEAAEAVRVAAREKPVTAVVNGMAASAAYALASGATRVVTTPTGLAGSIGVVMLHADYSRYLDEKGITPTLIFAGAHKVDGNPFEPLPPGVREDLQREVEQFYGLFVKTVSAGRKGMSAAAVRATEARTFIGKDAIDVGLADELGTFESALADLTRGASRLNPSQPKGKQMDKNEGEAGATNTGVSKADHDAAVAKARADGKAEGIAEGTKVAAERFKAILGSEHAKGREALASHLAFETDTPAAGAISILEKSPKGASATPTIDQRMNGQGKDLALGGPLQRSADAGAPPAKINTSDIYAKRAAAAAAAAKAH